MDRAAGVQAVLDQGIAAYTQTHRLSARQAQVCAHSGPAGPRPWAA